VIKEGWEALRKGEVFTEFFLMSIATIGAFAIGEYPEGVAVMLNCSKRLRSSELKTISKPC